MILINTFCDYIITKISLAAKHEYPYIRLKDIRKVLGAVHHLPYSIQTKVIYELEELGYIKLCKQKVEILKEGPINIDVLLENS